MKILTLILLFTAQFAFSGNFAVTFFTGDPTGIPDGWPSSRRSLGDATGPLKDGETLISDVDLNALLVSLAPAMDARNARIEARQRAPLVIPQELRQRVAPTEFDQLKLDALQSEFVGLLLHAYLQNTELLLLVTKAVAGTAATNNLSVAERARVVALRPQLAFPQQSDFVKADRDRAVEIRDKVLVPHYALYRAARDLLAAVNTNSVPPDPGDGKHWPGATIGE